MKGHLVKINWSSVQTLRVTRDNSDPHWHGNEKAEVVRDTAENLKVMFDHFRKDWVWPMKSCGWHDYTGPTVSVNQYFKKHNIPSPAGIIAWKELGY